MSRYEYEMMQRPSVVTAASVLLYVFAGFGIIGSLILFGMADESIDPGTVQLVATITLALAVVYLVLATMILKGRNGARITAIVLLVISIVLDVINFDATSIISIGLALLVIGLLAWNRDAKAYFDGV